MLDIPYYLSHHQPKMIAAVIREANRIYKLWSANNPGFSEYGRVHIIAHSLGSVMALDILSQQPTTIPEHLSDPVKVDLQAQNIPHFLFRTHNLFLAGSPAGFFLLLKRANLLPRIDLDAPNKDPDTNTSAVCGVQGTYGCLAVSNVYNIINPYDPVSYRLNAAVDAAYARSLRPAWIPSASPGWFSGSGGSNSGGSNTSGRGSWFGRSREGTPSSTTTPSTAATTLSNTMTSIKTVPTRAPSNLELETHDFPREQVAEARMRRLNDNGQIDFLLRYGGGPLEISQYLTMLGAHSSYWLSRDFVRCVVVEIGKGARREGMLGMRAVKRKGTGVAAVAGGA